MFRPPSLAYAVSVAVLRLVIAPLSRRGKAYVQARLIQGLDPVWERETDFGPIKFYCVNQQTFNRASKADRKELDTNRWLKAIPAGSVFWDVGANVGLYSLLAASQGLTVCSFEPEAANCNILQRNLDLNNFQDRVTALNVALSDRTGRAHLKLATHVAGAAKHQVSHGKPEDRNIVTFSGSDLVSQVGLPSPNYVKIDVDGFELAVLQGLNLDQPALRQVYVEMRDNSDAPEIMTLMASKGFTAGSTLDDIRAAGGKVSNVLFARPDRNDGVDQ
jgi:FkbM family methyltransferase